MDQRNQEVGMKGLPPLQDIIQSDLAMMGLCMGFEDRIRIHHEKARKFEMKNDDQEGDLLTSLVQ
jgi:hypothetical protein